MKISIAGTVVLLTLASAMAVPGHAAAPAAATPRTSQTTKPAPKPAAGQPGAGQDARANSQRSRQQVKPQSGASDGIYSNNVGGNAPAGGSYTCTGGACESPGAVAAQRTGGARASEPGEPSTYKLQEATANGNWIRSDGADGKLRNSSADQKSSELDKSTPILNNKQPTPSRQP